MLTNALYQGESLCMDIDKIYDQLQKPLISNSNSTNPTTTNPISESINGI